MTEDDHTPPVHLPDEPSAAHRAARVERLERHMEAMEQAVAMLTTSRATTNRILYLAIPLLLGALGTVLHFAAEKIATSAERTGRMEATVDALKEQQRGDREEIAQLRAALLRLSGGDHRPPTSDDLRVPDRYGALDQGAGAGGNSPQWPKLQRPQPACGKIAHSGPLLQMSPQRSGWRTSSIRRARSIDSPAGSGSLGGAGGEAHDAIATMIPMILHIPEM